MYRAVEFLDLEGVRSQVPDMGKQDLEIPGNAHALGSLREIVSSGQAIAFVGAGASAGLYPLWNSLLMRLADEAVARGFARPQERKQWLAGTATLQATAQSIKRALGDEIFGELIHDIFRPRPGEDGKHFTPIHRAILRLPFKGFVTTNYDPGLIEARRVVRQEVANTSYATWRDRDAVGRWVSGDVFNREVCPIFFAHGSYDRGESIVLTSDDFHAAYDSGGYRYLFEGLWLRERLVLVGFGFSDPWLEFLLGSVIRKVFGGRSSEPRHVALLGMRRKDKYSSDHRKRFHADYNSLVYYYTIKTGLNGVEDHGDLLRVLESLCEPATSVARSDEAQGSPNQPVRVEECDVHVPSGPPVQRWVHEATDDDRFVGRRDELDRLDAWAHDPSVRTFGITGLGGLGKTSLVGRWIRHFGGIRRRPIRGVFFWSFYSDRSVGNFLEGLRRFAEVELGFEESRQALPIDAAVAVIRLIPLLVVLDGLEVLQESPEDLAYGTLLDLDLRDFLVACCRVEHRGLVVLTSRFPFRDLSRYLGISYRALALERLIAEDGALLLARCGVEGTAEARGEVSRKLEGHPLALRVFAAALATQADRDPTRLLTVLFERSAMDESEPLQGKICRMLAFYEEHLPAHRKALMRLISLFRSPIDQGTLKRLAKKLPATRDILGDLSNPILKCYLQELRSEQLVLREQSRGTGDLFSCHPILRDHFRASMMGSEQTAALAVADLLRGRPANEHPKDLGELEPVLSAIELLQQAGDYERADELYRGRLKEGYIFRFLPAPHEGLNCALGFVADATRRERCLHKLGRTRLSYYLNAAGLHGAFAGELRTAVAYYRMADELKRTDYSQENRISGLLNKTWALAHLGHISEAISEAYNAFLASQHESNVETGIRSIVHYAYALAIKGEVDEAQKNFVLADNLQKLADKFGRGLLGLASIWWAEFLLRARRPESAREKVEATIGICSEEGWKDDIARCDLMLGRLSIIEGDHEKARESLAKSEIVMRKAHMMTELSQVLLVRADLFEKQEAWDDALRLAEEALELTRLRGMLPGQADSLVARGRVILASMRRESTTRSLALGLRLNMARDDAQSALEIARGCGYRWAERDALSLMAETSSTSGDVTRTIEYRHEAENLDRQLELSSGLRH